MVKRAPYTSLTEQLLSLGWDKVDGILLDLGASSMQFDTPERGFSFLADGPLDMRFDPANPLTAGQIINTWMESELADIIFRYGEETGQPAHRPGNREQAPHRKHPPVGGGDRESHRAARSAPPGHADLPGTADRRQRRIGSGGEGPSAGSEKPEPGRQAGSDQFPLAGGPVGERLLPPGKPGLHLPTRTTGLHLRA